MQTVEHESGGPVSGRGPRQACTQLTLGAALPLRSVNGLGISIGKLDLYVAGGGFDPAYVLPIVIDVGSSSQHCTKNGQRKAKQAGRQQQQASQSASQPASQPERPDTAAAAHSAAHRCKHWRLLSQLIQLRTAARLSPPSHPRCTRGTRRYKPRAAPFCGDKLQRQDWAGPD